MCQKEDGTEQQGQQGRIGELRAGRRLQALDLDVLVAIAVNQRQWVRCEMVLTGLRVVMDRFVRMIRVAMISACVGERVLMRIRADVPMPMRAREPHGQQGHADQTREQRSVLAKGIQHLE